MSKLSKRSTETWASWQQGDQGVLSGIGAVIDTGAEALAACGGDLSIALREFGDIRAEIILANLLRYGPNLDQAAITNAAAALVEVLED